MTEPAKSARPPLMIQPAVPARAPKPPPVTGPWRLSMLLAAPHRLGFCLAMLVLAAASGWWLLVQVGRWHGWPLPSQAVVPTVTHATVMVLGFMPLFFAGFLFTAGPKWLNVEPYAAPRLLAPLGLQAAGWLLWLAGAYLGLGLALAGLALACAGLGWTYALFWRLIAASPLPDRVHATAAGVGGLIGTLCLAGIGLALLARQPALALALARTALWGFIAVTFAAVTHRMIPFFTSGVLPMIAVWRPFWVLWLMLGVAAFEVLSVWVDYVSPVGNAWPLWLAAQVVARALAGGVLLWLAVVWGLVQSLKVRLLAMLHVGFVWLGLGLLYGAASQALWLVTGRAVLGLGAPHALGMGFLGSLMVAMVTRVSCGHSGRSLVADGLVWALFWLLQVAVGVRLLAAVQDMPQALTVLAALLWTAATVVWALRYANWYGRPRIDGKPG